MTSIEEIKTDRMFDSKDKADSYVKAQEMEEIFPNQSGFDHPKKNGNLSKLLAPSLVCISTNFSNKC